MTDNFGKSMGWPDQASFETPEEKGTLKLISDEESKLRKKWASIYDEIWGKTRFLRLPRYFLSILQILVISVCIYFALDLDDDEWSDYAERYFGSLLCGWLLWASMTVDSWGRGWGTRELIALLSEAQKERYDSEITKIEEREKELKSRRDAINDAVYQRFKQDRDIRFEAWRKAPKSSSLRSRRYGGSRRYSGYYDDASDVGDSGSGLGDTMGGDDGGE